MPLRPTHFILHAYRCGKCNCWTWLVEKCCISSIFSKKRSCIDWMMRFERRSLSRQPLSRSNHEQLFSHSLQANERKDVLESGIQSAELKTLELETQTKILENVSFTVSSSKAFIFLLNSKCFDCKLASHPKIGRSNSTI